MAYTTINKSTDYFNTKLYTGNGGTQSITGVGHQPDFNWIKCRSNATDHALQDIVRGNTKSLQSNSNSADATVTNGVTAFTSDGFNLGAGGDVNTNGRTYCSWNWKAGTSFSNSAGANGASIASTGSANQDVGFSICTYTNTNTNTIKHGLDVVPDVIIAKTLGVSGSWFLGSEKMLGGWNKKLNLDSTGAVATETRPFYPGSAAPTSSVFSSDQSVFGAGGSATETMIAYCFAEKQGYSKFGSYIGNGNANGPMIYTGFKPAFVIIKRTSSGGDDWVMYDNKRNTFNVLDKRLNPNSNGAEQDTDILDFLSNGFKLRGTPDYVNGNGSTYIYMAFGQTLVGTNNIPANAR